MTAPPFTVEQLERLGGTFWDAMGKRRVYFNNVRRWVPDLTQKPGSIRLFFDLDSQEFGYTGALTGEQARNASMAITKAVAEMPEQLGLL